MPNHEKGKVFVVGAVVGSVVGAVTALLLAPKSGKQLRADISEQAAQLSDSAQRLAGQVSQKTQQLAKTVSTQTEELVTKAKNAATGLVEDVKAWKESRNAEKEEVSAAATVEGAEQHEASEEEAR
ncbi:YtxH domain-containing protein [Paenibacillus sp. y28]|uniref:YtxH domain-containing protein n=1 Tax=Paenibacillus sp. y28 TaxID=3129110 RepID=UPI00301A45FF